MGKASLVTLVTDSIPRSDHEYLGLQAVNTDGRRQAVTVGVSYGDPVYFSLRFDETGESFSCEAPDAFFALNAARKQFEPQGWRFLCCGAQRDCYAFGSLLSTSLGERLYRLIPGKPASEEDAVFIFDEANAADVGSLDEQRACYTAWQSGKAA